MQNLKKSIVAGLILVQSLLFFSCRQNIVNEKYFRIIENTSNNLKVELFDKKIYKVPKQPQRVIILYNSLLNPWKISGGKIIGRVKAHRNLPKWQKDIPVVGNMGSPNVEIILANKPDLVLLADNMKAQNKMKKLLTENNIPYLPIRYDNYYDFLDIIELFSIINKSESQLKKLKQNLESEFNKVISENKFHSKLKALILFATTKSITCELSNGDTGTLLDIIGVENIIHSKPLYGNSRVDISLEKILELNPDVIFIKTMGDVSKSRERLKKFLFERETWQSIKAVKKGYIYFLPKEMFVYKANYKYPDAIKYLSGLLRKSYE